MLKLKIPPAVVFILFVGMVYGIGHLMPNAMIDVPYQEWLAYGIFGIGVIIGLLGVVEFARRSTTVNPHKPENTSELVKSGVYRYSRNPMYVGLFMGLLAIVIFRGSIWAAVVLPLFVWYMNTYQIKPEEVVMKEKFGEEFKNYKKQVNRWI